MIRRDAKYCVSTRGWLPAFMFIVAVLIATPAHADITTGLVGYWKMDEGSGTTLVDSSIYGNNGSLTNSPVYVPGKSGKAVSFDGSNQFADLGDPGSLFDFGSGDFTVAYWVSRQVNCSGWDNVWGVNKWNTGSAPGSNEWGVNFCGASGNTNVAGFSLQSGNTTYSVNGGTTLSLNSWYFIVGVRSGRYLYFYVNGLSDATPVDMGSVVSVNNVGRTIRVANSFMNAYYSKAVFDEVRIYNRALTSADVAELYLVNVVPTDGLVSWWTFDEGSGTTVRDPVGNNTGTLSGGAKPTFISGKSGAGLSFNGSSSYVNIAETLPLSINSAFSLSAWIKIPSIVSGATPISKGGVGGTASNYAIDITATGAIRFFVYDNGSVVRGILGTTSMIPLNTWTHVVGTYDGSTFKVFFNGVQDATTASWTLTSMFQSANAARIGARYTSNFYNGSIDDVRIYNRALFASQVAALYQAENGPGMAGIGSIQGVSAVNY